MEILEPWIPYLAGLGGFLVGLVLTWILCRARANTLTARYEERQKASKKAIVDLEAGCANLEAEARQLRHSEAVSLKRQAELELLAHSQQRTVEEKQQLLKEAEHRMSQNFKALSAEALKATQAEFLELARSTFETSQKEATSELEQRRVAVETLVKPVAATLSKVESRIGDLERARHESEATLGKHVREIASAQAGLRHETANLAKALRQPAGRGRWTDIQLKRVVELAGMQKFCDFHTSPAAEGENASPKGPRPDLIVNLPTGRQIAVDSRAPLDAYLASIEAGDESQQAEELKRHAAALTGYMADLASPAYRDQFQPAPEFVVLFLPSESIFSAALAEDTGLLERGIQQGVILATPTTLVALLRAAAAGWQQEGLADKARNISKVGRELYSRVSSLANHMAQVGQSLDDAVQHYNRTVGSLEGGVLPGARELGDLEENGTAQALPSVPLIEHAVRKSHAECESDLSNLPVSKSEDPPPAASQHPDPSSDRFTGPAPTAVNGPKTKVRFRAGRQVTDSSADPEPESAANDLRAALPPQKKAG